MSPAAEEQGALYTKVSPAAEEQGALSPKVSPAAEEQGALYTKVSAASGFPVRACCWVVSLAVLGVAATVVGRVWGRRR